MIRSVIGKHGFSADVIDDIDALVGIRDVDYDAELGRVVSRTFRVEAASGDIDLLVSVSHHHFDEIFIFHFEEGIDPFLYLFFQPFLVLYDDCSHGIDVGYTE